MALGENGTEALNNDLSSLNELFPNIEVSYLRELLSNISEESRLFLIAETLLKKARTETQNPNAGRKGRINPWERFRSHGYRKACRATLAKEFKGLSKSTIDAVMAENNYDYERSRSTLLGIAAKSWRFSVSSWWFRRKRPDQFIDAVTKPSGNAELDRELFKLGSKKRCEQIAEDQRLANLVNQAEHAAADELVECECCFGDFAWEEVVACNLGHLFCRACLNHAVKEISFGQGSNLQLEGLSVKCLSSTADPPCTSSVPESILRVGLSPELFRILEDRVAEDCIHRSGLAVIRCPFCRYAEIDERRPYRLKFQRLIFFIPLLLALFRWKPLILCVAFSLVFSLQLLSHLDSPKVTFIKELSMERILDEAARRKQRRERRQTFKCLNTRDGCLRISCQNCQKEWDPFHKCYEEEEDGLRIYVERVMAEAVKRTCPICGLSFIKSDGCNKLICPCGYVMCYICRADIKAVGYRHFCQHFRQVPGTACSECDQCDLYLQEDESQTVKLAASRAEQEYLSRDNRTPGWQPSSRQIAGVNLDSKSEGSFGGWLMESYPIKPLRNFIRLVAEVAEIGLDSLIDFEDDPGQLPDGDEQ